MNSPATPVAATATPTEIPPWCPVVEANQGLISILALLLALFAFLYETHRANRATADRAEEFRRALIAAVDQMETYLEEGKWALSAKTSPRLITALLSAPPPAPALIAAAVEVLTEIELETKSTVVASLLDDFKDNRRAKFDSWRKKFRDA